MRCLIISILLMCPIFVLADSASQPVTQPASAAVRSFHAGNLKDILDTWNQNPQERKEASSPPETREEPYFNLWSRKNEKAVVVEQRFPIQHVSPEYVLQSVRPVLSQGLGRVDLDAKLGELVIVDQAPSLKVAEKIIAAIDTPRPGLVFRVPSQNAAETGKLLRSLLSAQGSLQSITPGVFIAHDEVDNLRKMNDAFQRSGLRLRKNTASADKNAWRSEPRKPQLSANQQPLKIETSYGGETLSVEQRSFPLLYASPQMAVDAMRQVVTRGLGLVHYDPATSMLVVTDRPEILLKVDAYLRVFDTSKPARLLKIAPETINHAKEKIQQRLSSEGKIHVFEKDGVLIVQDTPKALSSVHSIERSGRLFTDERAASVPAQLDGPAKQGISIEDLNRSAVAPETPIPSQPAEQQ